MKSCVGLTSVLTGVLGVLSLPLTAPCPAAQAQTAEPNLRWVDARTLTIEGKGWAETKQFYDRLPARAEATVRPAVWRLAQNSAGLSVRFVTDADTLVARWTLRNEALALPHMPATGVSGLDLYVREARGWRWLANGRPEKAPTNERVLVRGLSPGRREYRLYLPLYNGVEEVSLGIPDTATLQLAPACVQKPVVFYGTSIVQGGCASRPGMAYPAILGRRLDWPTINLGFSGNALAEPEIAQLLAELDPAVYVLDPLPNLTAARVAERLEPFLGTLRAAHPRTPIVLVENLEYPDGQWVAARRERVTAANAQLKQIYRRLIKAGDKRLLYVPAPGLIGADGEGTVDGTHPTDLGFVRMAEALAPVLKRALRTGR